MYAQAFELPGTEPSARLEQSINDELFPALRTEAGFCGALSLVRRETGEILLLVFWETENEAASPLHPSSPRCSTSSGRPRRRAVCPSSGKSARAYSRGRGRGRPAVQRPVEDKVQVPIAVQSAPAQTLGRVGRPDRSGLVLHPWFVERTVASLHCLEPAAPRRKSGGATRCEREPATRTITSTTKSWCGHAGINGRGRSPRGQPISVNEGAPCLAPRSACPSRRSSLSPLLPSSSSSRPLLHAATSEWASTPPRSPAFPATSPAAPRF